MADEICIPSKILDGKIEELTKDLTHFRSEEETRRKQGDDIGADALSTAVIKPLQEKIELLTDVKKAAERGA